MYINVVLFFYVGSMEDLTTCDRSIFPPWKSLKKTFIFVSDMKC